MMRLAALLSKMPYLTPRIAAPSNIAYARNERDVLSTSEYFMAS